MAALLALEHVSKTYGEGGGMVRALDNVDLAISPGEFVAIMGSSTGTAYLAFVHILCRAYAALAK